MAQEAGVLKQEAWAGCLTPTGLGGEGAAFKAEVSDFLLLWWGLTQPAGPSLLPWPGDCGPWGLAVLGLELHC